MLDMRAHSMFIGLLREAEEVVDQLFHENGPYKAIEFRHKYAKPVSDQYMVSSSE